MDECLVVVGTCVGVGYWTVMRCKLSQINLLYCVCERKLHVHTRGSVKAASGCHKKLDFVGGYSRFGPKHCQQSPLACGAVSQTSPLI